jgi:dTMP kinase
MNPGAGRLIALEGIDGCGKSTQARILSEALGALLTFEPGATELGALLRTVLLDHGRPSPGPRSEALLMAADRAQHVDEVLVPTLAEGRWVVTDRYSGSTVAYQGWGRELGAATLAPVLDFAAGGLAADLAVLVDVPLDLARERLATLAPDRLERLDEGFHDRVRRGFLAQAAEDPLRWGVVDGAGTVEEVAAQVSALVHERLGAAPGVWS